MMKQPPQENDPQTSNMHCTAAFCTPSILSRHQRSPLQTFLHPHPTVRPLPTSRPFRRPRKCQMIAQTSTNSSPSIDANILKSLSKRNIVITGGTGLIGSALVSQLRKCNSNVYLFSRNPSGAQQMFSGSEGGFISALKYDARTEQSLSPGCMEAISNADAVINLAGEPVDEGRWVDERKKVLFSSRVTGTNKIVQALRTCGSTAVLINASAVGYYGTSETKTFTEDAAPGTDFLARTAAAWEDAALANSAQSRTVVFRIGVVLANGGGALEKMSIAFKAFLGGPPGGGRQWFSWVHIDDIVRLILHAATDERWEGVYNATAPQPVRLEQFCAELGRALGRPSWLPVPKGAVRALMGSEAAELILKGQQVLPKRVRENGFVYRYKDVASALNQLTKRRKSELTRTK